jgi:hypothetical protein
LIALYQAPKTKTEQTATIDHLAALKLYNELIEEVTARAGSINALTNAGTHFGEIVSHHEA